MMVTTPDIRPSPLAGKWYPADPHSLAQQIDRYLDRAQNPALEGDLIAVIAPHAGIQYSGPVAGHAFAALRGLTPDIVAVLAPMHQPAYQPLLTTAHTAYATPLGLVSVNAKALRLLDHLLHAELGFGLAPVANDSEHALEIELPYLQRALTRSFNLLPVMVRDQSETTARGLGRALASLATAPELDGQSLFIVASTDLSHFYSQRVAEVLDGEILRRIEALDPAGVIQANATGHGFACGCGALAATLWAALALGANRAQLLRHATSGDVTGDYERVVGYAAAALVKMR